VVAESDFRRIIQPSVLLIALLMLYIGEEQKTGLGQWLSVTSEDGMYMS